ncbi:MAG: hypothetical protein D3923_13630 [Candidatus Electrothrix sp. AR3]|nr:hypothetical protein [Candidatus Electrothrix sp. AR3]
MCRLAYGISNDQAKNELFIAAQPATLTRNTKVVKMPGTKRLVIELPESQHRAIKAEALLRGISMKEYVLEKLGKWTGERSKKTTDSLFEALQEVRAYRNGEKELRSAQDFFSDAETIK